VEIRDRNRRDKINIKNLLVLGAAAPRCGAKEGQTEKPLWWYSQELSEPWTIENKIN
jgi:hypothetical protein